MSVSEDIKEPLPDLEKVESYESYSKVGEHYFRSLVKRINIDDVVIGLQLVGVTVGVSILGLFLYYVVVK